MNRITGFFLVIAALLIGVWWWRKNSVPSPLDVHFADLTARSEVGDIAQQSAFFAQPMAANVGSGWGTTMAVNANNPRSNNNLPGKLNLNMRFAQPGGF